MPHTEAKLVRNISKQAEHQALSRYMNLGLAKDISTQKDISAHNIHHILGNSWTMSTQQQNLSSSVGDCILPSHILLNCLFQGSPCIGAIGVCNVTQLRQNLGHVIRCQLQTTLQRQYRNLKIANNCNLKASVSLSPCQLQLI